MNEDTEESGLRNVSPMVPMDLPEVLREVNIVSSDVADNLARSVSN